MNFKEKVKAYINKVKLVLAKAEFKDTRKEVIETFDYAKRYCFDAEYFFDKKDFASALACISYAEGILDALRLLNLIEFEWT